MAVQGKKLVDHLQVNSLKFLPLVQTKDGTYLFHPGFIYQSLLKETNISKSNAQKITEQVIRFLISAKLKLITAPSIREVVNVHLLKNGFEKERLQYTRIGLPFRDLKELLNNNTDSEDIVSNILNWIISEFHAVNKLIKEKEREENK
ncbi:MAG: hypothetical protein ACFFDF_17530 [Candidatus Odinarchaeota archaeon]